MPELPEKYYIARWMPKKRKDIRDKQYNIPIDFTTSMSENDSHETGAVRLAKRVRAGG